MLATILVLCSMIPYLYLLIGYAALMFISKLTFRIYSKKNVTYKKASVPEPDMKITISDDSLSENTLMSA